MTHPGVAFLRGPVHDLPIMQFSEFGSRFAGTTGIGQLMDDLGDAFGKNPGMRMLGGGNPGHIPEMDRLWASRLGQVLDEPGRIERVLGDYDPPSGGLKFREAMAESLAKLCGWDITAENIGVTSGGQTAFFFLFNLLAGRMADGSRKKVLFPLMPEYIGYADQCMDMEMFRGAKPEIEFIGDRTFKYHVDFDALKVGDDVAALCVSRPTNPTGNVLTDEEIRKLSEIAGERGIPLIIDNAYGAPFPNAIFTETTPRWNPDMILTLSLSKLGLPGTRTGIVIAKKEIISALSTMTAVVGLANGNVGQAIVEPLLRSGEIFRLAREVIRPWYLQRSLKARAWAEQYFPSHVPWRLHKSEGAFFLWLWAEGLPITDRAFYERLKARDVLVVPGSYFFFGLDDAWAHRNECLRITFTQPPRVVEEGLAIIGEELDRAFS